MGSQTPPVPLVDHHAHRILRDAAHLSAERYRRCFSESDDPAIVAHVPTTLFYRQALRLLSAPLDCAPAESAILERRAALGTENLTRTLFADAQIETVLIDSGFARGETLSEPELAEASGAHVLGVLRIEALAESLLPTATTFEEFTRRLRTALRRAPDDGYVALKSIIAYRSGLAVRRPAHAEAVAEWKALSLRMTREGPAKGVRLDRPALLSHVLYLAMDACAERGMPMQLHVGFGDRDVYLPDADPTRLRALLDDPRYRAVPIVLLHNYPYLRQAGYLAHLYANVYVDVSLAIPLVGPASRRVLEELLELAPSSKVLYASDAHSIPDLFWLGAYYATHAARTLAEEWIAGAVCSAREATRILESIFAENARAIYGIAAQPKEKRDDR
jgi:predicted TIM-barrel fold metal-dependent hydrolase